MTVFHKEFRYSVICLKNNFTSHPEILSRFKNEESENNLGNPSCKKIPTNLNLLIREGRSLVLISERWRTSNLDRVRVRPQRMTRMIEVFSMGVRWYKARWSVVWNIPSDVWYSVRSANRHTSLIQKTLLRPNCISGAVISEWNVVPLHRKKNTKAADIRD